MENFSSMDLPAILALNKIDLLEKKEDLMEKIRAFSGGL